MDGVVRACARPRIALFLGLIAGSLASFPSPLSAQTVSPRIVEFDPSPDHNASVNGVAVVREYELRFFAAGSTQRLHVIELGKPNVQSDGKIRFNFAALLGAWPVDGVVYEARVAAIGPGGSSQSAISNQFVLGTTAPPPPPPPPPPNCSYSLSTQSRSASSASTTGTVGVTAGTGCAWNASSDSAWLTITSGSSGSGTRSVGYSVSANSTTSQRVGRLRIAGATFTFTQTGAACAYSLSPTSRSVGSGTTTGSLGVTAGSGCAWTARSSGGWLTITGDASRSGNGTVNYSVAANRGSTARSATLTVGAETFTLTQSGSCTLVLSQESRGFNHSGGSASVAVTAGSGCSWTATRSGSWIRITSSSSGRGNGTVNYRVSANGGSSSRTGTLTVGGQPITISQAAATAPNAPAGLRIVPVR
jgi:Viral BACON domain/Putative binding domain, N-terminal